MTDTQTPQPVAVEVTPDDVISFAEEAFRNVGLVELSLYALDDMRVAMDTTFKRLAERARLTTDRSVGVELSLSETDTVEDVARYWHQEALKARAMLAATPPLPATSGEGEKLREALQPFANAADRLDYYGDTGDHYDGSKHSLYASRFGDGFLELLNGKDGDPLTITNLRAARAAFGTPDAAPIDKEGAGWIVGSADRKRWRTWADGECRWGNDREQATRYARRADAEAVHAEDDDAWVVEFYEPSPDAAPIEADNGYDERLSVNGQTVAYKESGGEWTPVDVAPIGSDDADCSGYVDAGDAK